MTTDTSRISISAHYTGYVWYKHGLSAPPFATRTGRIANATLTPVNAFLRRVAGADIDVFLLQRHSVIDYQLEQLIQEEGVEQVLELACGLSPRGYRLKQKYPQLHYIEGDLPSMAQRKHKLLRTLGVGAESHHQVLACNILEQHGSQSIQSLLQQFDPAKKTAIVTEGLVNYFDLNTIKQVWATMAQGLKQFPQGYYVTDLYPDFVEHPSYRYVQLAQKLVGFFTRGQWPLHYRSDSAIQQGFQQDGFAQVEVHDPASFYQTLNMPRAKTQTLVRIIRAAV